MIRKVEKNWAGQNAKELLWRARNREDEVMTGVGLFLDTEDPVKSQFAHSLIPSSQL